MTIAHSPLRYPGGKQILTRVISHLIKLNNAEGGTYIEPYAGGAGAAIGLLFGEHVHRIVINDADRCVHAMWAALLNQTEAFVRLIHETPTTIEEWEQQRIVYQNPRKNARLQVGFATFYLNRCNRSGIIASGGPIGGKGQLGKWKIDARFNRTELERRVRQIALYRDRITLSNMDGIAFLKEYVPTLRPSDKPFVYLDPPYYAKGPELYLNYYSPEDHAALAKYLRAETKFAWVLSYDDVSEVRRLYVDIRQIKFSLDYSARTRRLGREVMILKQGLAFPDVWKRSIPARFITSANGAPPMPSKATPSGIS